MSDLPDDDPAARPTSNQHHHEDLQQMINNTREDQHNNKISNQTNINNSDNMNIDSSNINNTTQDQPASSSDQLHHRPHPLAVTPHSPPTPHRDVAGARCVYGSGSRRADQEKHGDAATGLVADVGAAQGVLAGQRPVVVTEVCGG